MMRAVLYTDDMEPITVVSLPEYARDYLEECGIVNIPVCPPLTSYLEDIEAPPKITYNVVTIRAEIMVRNSRRHTLLFTNDDESALLLKSAFLPGQQATINGIKREEFARGFLEAIRVLGGMD